MVSGGAGSGKTTLLGILSAFIPDEERLITIEDAAELPLHRSHVVSLEARPPNIEGRGQATVRDLVRNALRMRPDRIIVGEVRGGEALDMLQAMNTGDDGSLSTAHANSCRHLLWRLETMAMMSDVELPAAHIRNQVASAIDVVVQLARLRDGHRVVWEIAAVEGTHRGEPVVSPLFRYRGRDGNEGFRGHGCRARVAHILSDRGEDVGDWLFEEGSDLYRSGGGTPRACRLLRGTRDRGYSFRSGGEAAEGGAVDPYGHVAEQIILVGLGFLLTLLGAGPATDRGCGLCSARGAHPATPSRVEDAAPGRRADRRRGRRCVCRASGGAFAAASVRVRPRRGRGPAPRRTRGPRRRIYTGTPITDALAAGPMRTAPRTPD